MPSGFQQPDISNILNKKFMPKLILILFAVILSACNQEPAASLTPVNEIEANNEVEVEAKIEPELIKSAHYFSSAWPITFWQEFEEDDVPAELQQIKDDGFNTVVLVVPWRGFEIGFDNPKTESNPILYQRLTFMLKAIVEHDLKFILRVGFPHFHMPEAKTYALEQCIGIYTDEKTQNQWTDYLEKIKQSVEPFTASSAGTLVSWEDFWCPHAMFPYWEDQPRLDMAHDMGYDKWLQQQNRNMVKVLLQQSDIKFNEIKIPQPAEFSYVLYLDFIDQMFAQKILKPTQTVFPNAAMEIRVDKLPIKDNEHYTWISHDLHLQETNLRGSYWAPFWGAENKGELISAEQALMNFQYFLNVVTDDGQNINHVIEQFNFYDNTIHYPNNANIKPEEIGVFLLAAAPLLKQYSRGFGVWAYRDYHDNAILNGSFEMGTEGWQIEGQAEIRTESQDQSLWMPAGTAIKQTFLPEKRFKLLVLYEQISICLVTDSATTFDILVDGELINEWHKKADQNCTQLPATSFKKPHPITITLTLLTHSDVLIDELKVYGFTQVLGLYDAEGNPSSHISSYRQLNALLEE